jgi:Zn-dependent protease with chaperone function
MHRYLLTCLAAFVAACSSVNPAKQPPIAGQHGTAREVSDEVLQTVLQVKATLEALSGVRAELVLVDKAQPNAYAAFRAGKPVIALSLGYLDRFGMDQHALAATVGHELAHLHLGHRAVRPADSIAFSGAVDSEAARDLAAFSREQEREADALGMRWALAAGYDACGQVRLLQAMARDLPAFSTHPSFAERVAAARTISGLNCG